MASQSTLNQASSIEIKKPLRPAFFDSSSLPWTPWVMEGTHFKLFNIDQKTGGFTMLLKVDAGNYAPVHGHLGAVEAYVVEGEFGYEDDRGGVGSYVYEAAGSIHQPTSPNGSIMFAVVHGPIIGYTEDGGIEGAVDGEAMLRLAREHGAADHLAHIAIT